MQAPIQIGEQHANRVNQAKETGQRRPWVDGVLTIAAITDGCGWPRPDRQTDRCEERTGIGWGATWGERGQNRRVMDGIWDGMGWRWPSGSAQ